MFFCVIFFDVFLNNILCPFLGSLHSRQVSMICRRFLLAKLELDVLCYFSTRSPKICLACRKTYIIPYRIFNGGTKYTECQSPGRSSEMAPPPRPPQASVSPPRIRGVTHTRLWDGGRGSQFIRRDRHYGTLYTNPFSLKEGVENHYIFQYQHRIRILREFSE